MLCKYDIIYLQLAYVRCNNLVDYINNSSKLIKVMEFLEKGGLMEEVN